MLYAVYPVRIDQLGGEGIEASTDSGGAIDIGADISGADIGADICGGIWVDIESVICGVIDADTG